MVWCDSYEKKTKNEMSKIIKGNGLVKSKKYYRIVLFYLFFLYDLRKQGAKRKGMCLQLGVNG